MQNLARGIARHLVGGEEHDLARPFETGEAAARPVDQVRGIQGRTVARDLARGLFKKQQEKLEEKVEDEVVEKVKDLFGFDKKKANDPDNKNPQPKKDAEQNAEKDAGKQVVDGVFDLLFGGKKKDDKKGP